MIKLNQLEYIIFMPYIYIFAVSSINLSLSFYSRILATEIGKLKIRQEQAELRELQFDSEDETGKVTDL